MQIVALKLCLKKQVELLRTNKEEKAQKQEGGGTTVQFADPWVLGRKQTFQIHCDPIPA